MFSTNSSFTRNLLWCLRQAGVEGHVFHAGTPGSLTRLLRCERWTQWPYQEFLDSEMMLPRITAYCRDNGIHVVVPANMRGSNLLSKIKDRLPTGTVAFPTSDPGLLETLRDKWSFAAFLRSRGFNTPHAERIETIEQAESIGGIFPAVLKPLQPGGKVRFLKVESSAELMKHLRADSPAIRLPALLQEYVPGIDVGLNVLADKGVIRAWSMQRWLGQCAIQFVEDDALLEMGQKIVEASGFTGVANFDLRIDERDRSAYFLECNPRFWGTVRASCWNGINFPAWGVRMSLGQTLPAAWENRGISYLLPSRFFPELWEGHFRMLKAASRYSLIDLVQTAFEPQVVLSRLRAA